MTMNSSSSSNNSTTPPNGPSLIYSDMQRCLISYPTTNVAFTATNFLIILPFCILVLYMGNQRRQQRRSGSAAAMATHSDIFTYHVIVMEMIGCLGFVFSSFYFHHIAVLHMGLMLLSFTWFGSGFFHILTCVERYLAVVHPVTYLGLKKASGIRMRNISIGCIWVLSIASSALEFYQDLMLNVDLCFLGFSLLVISFCSVSVLCVLIRPGPGDVSRDRVQVNQSKRKAFHTIMAILATLLLRFASNMILLIVTKSVEVSFHDQCALMSCQLWFNLPSSLVLPLLFLQRAGKLHCFKS